jgi:hypothetical protein
VQAGVCVDGRLQVAAQFVELRLRQQLPLMRELRRARDVDVLLCNRTHLRRIGHSDELPLRRSHFREYPRYLRIGRASHID